MAALLGTILALDRRVTSRLSTPYTTQPMWCGVGPRGRERLLGWEHSKLDFNTVQLSFAPHVQHRIREKWQRDGARLLLAVAKRE